MFLVFTFKFEGKFHTFKFEDDNIGFGAKYLPDCWGISKASGLSCVSVPPKVFCPAPPQKKTIHSESRHVTVLFYLRCKNCTKVCDQIANKSSLFVLLNASILRKYRRKTVFAICKFLAIYRTVIIAFSLKRCCSKSALLKSVLSVQIGPLLATIGVARGGQGGPPPPPQLKYHQW